MVNTEIRLIIFFADKDEALYNQQTQNQELTVAQIMNSLLKNSDLNWRNLEISKSGNLENSAGTTGLEKVFTFQSQRRAMPKNVQTTGQLHSFHMLAKKY